MYSGDIEKLWEDVHTLITSKFAEMEEQWTNMCQRMQHMEENIGTLQSTVGDLMSDPPSSSSNNSSPSGTSQKRKRKSPITLQVRVLRYSITEEF